MKFVLIRTTYRGDSEMVESLYYTHNWKLDDDTRLLSEAATWNTFDEAANFVETNNMDYKIVLIKDEKLFEARLKGT